MPEPDFDQIARHIGDEAGVARLDEWEAGESDRVLAAISLQLRQVWNAGKEAGGQHETFVTHLKDENTAAHLALDRCNAPKTREVPRRDGTGKQDITIGLAERVDATFRQVWNARGAADVEALERLGVGTTSMQGRTYQVLKALDR